LFNTGPMPPYSILRLFWLLLDGPLSLFGSADRQTDDGEVIPVCCPYSGDTIVTKKVTTCYSLESQWTVAAMKSKRRFTNCYRKFMIAMEVTGCYGKQMVAMGVISCYWKSMVALGVTNCYGKSRVAVKGHWLIRKSMVAMESKWLLWKSLVAMESHWLLCKSEVATESQ
jgi:hypothetical protein